MAKKADEVQTITISGPYHVWAFGGKTRAFGEFTLPFGQADVFFYAVKYNANTNKGEQRDIIEPHMKKLKKAVLEGTYTPTPVSVHYVKAPKKESLLKIENGQFSLEVSSTEPLHQTDGGHRFVAIASLRRDMEKDIKAEKDEERKVMLQARLDELLALPITATLYVDGDPKEDFIRLQAGRPVDKTHIMAMRIQSRLEDDPPLGFAFALAKVLNKKQGSPFFEKIRMDSSGSLPLPFTTIASTGASDIGTSLYGLAKVCLDADVPKDVEWATNLFVGVYEALKDSPKAGGHVFDNGKVLTPMGEGGKKGSATMLTGVVTCLAYQLVAEGKEEPAKADLTRLVKSARETLNEQVEGNFSSARKRELLQSFALDFFEDLEGPKHEGVPLELIKLLSASTFNVTPLPKGPRGRPRKVLPDVDGPAAAVAASEEKPDA